MMKFLFCSLDSPGFLFPAIGIAQALLARGHQVAFVTNLEQGGFLRSCGLERLPRGPRDGESFQVAQWGQPFAVAIQVKHIEHALEHFRADALVGQSLTLGALLVAERQRLPVGLLGFCTYLWPASDAPLQDARQSTAESWPVWRYRSNTETYNKVRDLFHLLPYRGSCRDTPLLGDLFLVRSVPELEKGYQDLPERVHLVGDCLWEPKEDDPELDSWLRDTAKRGLPLIYVQHGRFFHIPSFWPYLVEALENTECRVAVSVARFDGEIGTVPENFLIRPHIPQGRILAMSHLAIAAANTTVVLGALAAGVPSLLIPGGGEQPDVAELCQRAGVARTLLPNHASSENIRNGISEVLSNTVYRERAASLKEAFANIDSFATAADLLELLAERRKPILRRGYPKTVLSNINAHVK